jgi:hypothetical protein
MVIDRQNAKTQCINELPNAPIVGNRKYLTNDASHDTTSSLWLVKNDKYINIIFVLLMIDNILSCIPL